MSFKTGRNLIHLFKQGGVESRWRGVVWGGERANERARGACLLGEQSDHQGPQSRE